MVKKLIYQQTERLVQIDIFETEIETFLASVSECSE